MVKCVLGQLVGVYAYVGWIAREGCLLRKRNGAPYVMDTILDARADIYIKMAYQVRSGIYV